MKPNNVMYAWLTKNSPWNTENVLHVINEKLITDFLPTACVWQTSGSDLSPADL